MTLLGAIKEIQEYQMIVALPHHITGTLPITEVSDKFSEILEEVANDESAEDSTVA